MGVAVFQNAAVRCALPELTQRGQTGLVQPQLLLTQHLFAVAAVLFWQRRKFHQSGGSNWSTAPDLRMTFRCKMHELTVRGKISR